MSHCDAIVNLKQGAPPVSIVLPNQAAYLMNRLTACGHKAFAVGGCVRDSLMGRTPQDWDICTSALPDEMKQCFSDLHLVETGMKHGTLTVIVDLSLIHI